MNTTTPSKGPPCRVILLLDLDCFYAQCERVRLGLDLTTSLALLQWNSVLAVTYPARSFGIRRGDSWEAVATKSQNQCLALHLPLLTANTKNNAASCREEPEEDQEEDTRGTPSHPSSSDLNHENTLEEAYRREYHLTSKQKQHILATEVGRRRYHHEGKACLERYRVASSRIFSEISECLRQICGRDFLLERASIDELFVDVTAYCWKRQSPQEEEPTNHGHTPSDEKEDETVLVGGRTALQESDPTMVHLLKCGCQVAKHIRQSVFERLHFTLSAGISVNKTLAKLGASYGKPNGQAVITPGAISHVLQTTPLKKARNLGGKIGIKVQALLPPDATQLSDVARHLSLPQLVGALGQDTGQWVFDLVRGVDHEAVKETAGALVKSITAFKSFSRVSVSSGECHEWLVLLATDVVSRVQVDFQRNHRYPKSCTIQYAVASDTAKRGRVSKSLRLSFPTCSKTEDDVRLKLVEGAKNAMIAKEGKRLQLVRLGFCAADFQTRLRNGGISAFFSKGDDKPSSSTSVTRNAVPSAPANKPSLEDASREQTQCPILQSQPRKPNPPVVVDKDLELARKLQASYDRENDILTTAERRRGKQDSVSRQNRLPQRRVGIESFFLKK